MISATQLYDYVQCPHKVFMDAFGDAAEKDETSPFVELLWEQGLDHEEKVTAALNVTADLKAVEPADRERETLAATARHEPLIHGGRLRAGDLVGEPDLLEWTDAGYVPGEIKSGSGIEDDDNGGKLKKHYAFQVAHYVSILEKLGLGLGHGTPFVIDRKSERVPYPLMEPQGKRNRETWWDGYQKAVSEIRSILDRSTPSTPAMGSKCKKFCHWHSYCERLLISANDLTLIPELGRAKRDALSAVIPTIQAFAECDPKSYVKKNDETIFSGIRLGSLRKFHTRARLLTEPGATPYLTEAVHLPVRPREVYFDIEDDPMHDIVYLHGFVERMFGQLETARYVPHFAEGNEPGGEKAAFEAAWNRLGGLIEDSTIYYYAPHEKTKYNKLAEKYPEVCSVSEVKALFDRPEMIDLCNDVVRKVTEWPLYDRTLKTLARYLGFQWRDSDPSGAASIEWYNRWLESADPAIKRRILDYNEDDCLATGVVVDEIRCLLVKA